MELLNFGGFMCDFDGTGEWVGETLRVVPREKLNGECVLVLSFSEDSVTLSDPDNRCKNAYCGMNASFDEQSLPRAKTTNGSPPHNQ